MNRVNSCNYGHDDNSINIVVVFIIIIIEALVHTLRFRKSKTLIIFE